MSNLQTAPADLKKNQSGQIYQDTAADPLATVRPKLNVLSPAQIEKVFAESLRVLASGIYFEDDEACSLLIAKGAREISRHIISIPENMVRQALELTPKSIQLHTRDGQPTVLLGGDNSYFYGGAAVVEFMESDGAVRPSRAGDLVQITRLVEGLNEIKLHSTVMVPDDIPNEISDCYRLYLVLKHGTKPVIMGAFCEAGIRHFHELLSAAVGGPEELAARPRGLSVICASAPLKFTKLACRNVIDCARLKFPMGYISVPMPGAVSPATLAGSILVHTCELMAGLVLAQAVAPNTAVAYGGAPMNFDMRTMSPSMSSIEGDMIVMAYADIGKYFGLPTHCYGLLSDAKFNDFQGGAEDALSGVLTALSGVNIISGLGMLEFGRITSLEKFAMDNDIAGMINYLKRGVEISEATLATDLIIKQGPGGGFINTSHTQKNFRKQSFFPSDIFDRSVPKDEERAGQPTVQQRATAVVKKVLEGQPKEQDFEGRKALDEAMRTIMKRYDIKSLPEFDG